MRLTKENAYLYEGKTLDAKVKLWHYYPLRVKKNMHGELMVVDKNDVWMEIPSENNLRERIDFDFVTESGEFN